MYCLNRRIEWRYVPRRRQTHGQGLPRSAAEWNMIFSSQDQMERVTSRTADCPLSTEPLSTRPSLRLLLALPTPLENNGQCLAGHPSGPTSECVIIL